MSKKGDNRALIILAAAGAAYYLTTRNKAGEVAFSPAAAIAPAPMLTPDNTGGFWSAIASNLTPASNVYPVGTVISSTGVPVIPTSAGDYAAATRTGPLAPVPVTPVPVTPVTPAPPVVAPSLPYVFQRNRPAGKAALYSRRFNVMQE